MRAGGPPPSGFRYRARVRSWELHRLADLAHRFLCDRTRPLLARPQRLAHPLRMRLELLPPLAERPELLREDGGQVLLVRHASQSTRPAIGVDLRSVRGIERAMVGEHDAA